MPKVLIIEDDDITLRLIRAGLRHDPAWELLFAANGQQGLELALQQQHALSAVILDVFLPKLDGRVIAERLRASAPDLPIIGISGDAAALPEMMARGCTYTFAKPISGVRFAELLRSIVAPSNASALPARQGVSEQRAADRVPIPGMQLLDLDLNKVRQHIAVATERRGYDGATEPIEFLLEHGGVIGDNDAMRPTVAGALAFSPRPERWIAASGIDIAEFSSENSYSTNIRFQQQVRGNVFTVIERTVDLLWARIDHAYQLDGVRGVEQFTTHAYPRVVLRELTVNALCHRDWSYEGSIVRIQVFPTRIEWISPGGLPPGVTVTALRDTQVARNPALAQFLYEAGVIERFGLGMDTVLDTLHAEDHPPPEMIDLGHAFIVRVFAKPLPDAEVAVAAAAPERGMLTERQRRLLDALAEDEERSSAELAQTIGEPIWTVQRDLGALIGEKKVVAIGNTRSRRYRRADR